MFPRVAVLIMSAALLPAGLAAQQPRAAWLPASHWTQAALRRAAALGAIDASAAFAAWPLRRSEARHTLAVAAHVDATAAAAHNFEREYPAADGAAVSYDLRTGAGWTAVRGELLAGASFRGVGGKWEYPGPVSAPEARDGFLTVAGDLTWRALTVELAAAAGNVTSLRHASAGLALGPIDIRAGRFALADGHGTLVLSALDAFEGFGIGTNRPLDPPGFLDVLGPVTASLHLARFERSGPITHPWFSAASVSLAPTPGLHIGLNRAVLFGGDGNVESTSAGNVLFMLFGLTSQLGKDSGFENQVASIDVWTRLSAFGLPLAAYGELGSDDVGFSFLRAAATVAGLELPAVPGLRALSLGLEHTRIPRSCCGHPPWYRHGELSEGWTDRGRLIGHPLGGHGWQWALDAGLTVERAQLSARAFRRWRGQENLLAADRAGLSTGVEARGDVWLGSYVQLQLRGATEHGDSGWRAWSAEVGAAVRVVPRRGQWMAAESTREAGNPS